MYQREDDTVTLTMTVEEYQTLLIGLGYTLVIARGKDPDLYVRWIKLVNSINDGNPKWTPYEVPK
jgi:hypothetical protein